MIMTSNWVKINNVFLAKKLGYEREDVDYKIFPKPLLPPHPSLQRK
jgi:hypothetical protein